MAQNIRQVMTADLSALDAGASVADAARLMRDREIGDVIVCEGNELRGIVTDRDIVVRAVAEGRNPDKIQLSQICSGDVVTLSPDATVEDAARLMRDKALRRVVVAQQGHPVGIVSIGDLAMTQDPGSVLADISTAPSNA